MSKFILYSLTYNAIDVMDDNYLAIALSVQIQVSMVLIDTVRKQSVDPSVLAK